MAEPTGIKIAPKIKRVSQRRFKRIPGCFDKTCAPVKDRRNEKTSKQLGSTQLGSTRLRLGVLWS